MGYFGLDVKSVNCRFFDAPLVVFFLEASLSVKIHRHRSLFQGLNILSAEVGPWPGHAILADVPRKGGGNIFLVGVD